MKGTSASIRVEPNGALTVSNDRTMITIQPDGTVAVSSLDPVQLVGACLAKFDDSTVNSLELAKVTAALHKRLEKRA